LTQRLRYQLRPTVKPWAFVAEVVGSAKLALPPSNDSSSRSIAL
jgi:hypothetical protein